MKRIKTLLLLLALALSPSLWAGPININTADAPVLAQGIDGVGEKRAQAIVDYRNVHGPFTTVDGLSRVKGIGAATIEKNRDNLTTGE